MKRSKQSRNNNKALHRQFKNLQEQWVALNHHHHQPRASFRRRRRTIPCSTGSSGGDTLLNSVHQLLDKSPRGLMSSLQETNHEFEVEELIRERRALMGSSSKVRGRRLHFGAGKGGVSDEDSQAEEEEEEELCSECSDNLVQQSEVLSGTSWGSNDDQVLLAVNSLRPCLPEENAESHKGFLEKEDVKKHENREKTKGNGLRPMLAVTWVAILPLIFAIAIAIVIISLLSNGAGLIKNQQQTCFLAPT